MKPFNLEEAKAGKKVCTRAGLDARILCYDFKILNHGHNKNVILAAVYNSSVGNEYLLTYMEDGTTIDSNTKEDQLMMKSEKREGYVAIFKFANPNLRYVKDIILETEERAKNVYQGDKDLVAISKIEWEE